MAQGWVQVSEEVHRWLTRGDLGGKEKATDGLRQRVSNKETLSVAKSVYSGPTAKASEKWPQPRHRMAEGPDPQKSPTWHLRAQVMDPPLRPTLFC